MDSRLLRHYNEELQHLREMGAEFAQQFPKIVAPTRHVGIEVTDPVCRASARRSRFPGCARALKLDAEFPRFTQRLLEIVYPNYLAPTPSMLIGRFFEPDLEVTDLAQGFTIPRGSALHAQMGRNICTACQFERRTT